MNPLPPRRLGVLILSLLGWAMTLGLQANPLFLPYLEMPYVGVFGRPYHPNSPDLPVLLKESKGDQERGVVLMTFADYSIHTQRYYYGQEMLSWSDATYNLRTREIRFRAVVTHRDRGATLATTVSTDPFKITIDEASQQCYSHGGQISMRRTARTTLQLAHRVQSQARNASLHAWKQVGVTAFFFTTPIGTDCQPAAKTSATRHLGRVIPRGGEVTFDTRSIGFQNESCDPYGNWALALSLPAK
jgi:hypothetical protein